MTKGFKDTSEYLEKIVTLKNESNNLTYKELKAKQDALANEINSEVKLGKIKSANAEELKKKIYEIGIANKKTEGTTDTGGTGKPKKVKIKAEAEIETFEVTEVPLLETNNISIRPKTLTIGKPIKPILIEIEESETEKMFKNLAKSLTDGFSKIDYTSIFKKKETAFDESLNEDRANLLTSLQQNELSYEEYSERLNEIDRNRRETQKEGNSAFIQGLNETLAVAFEGVNTTVNDSLGASVSKLAELDENSKEYSKGMTDSITLAMLSIGTATAEMALQGQDMLKALALNTIKAARSMFNAYMGALVAKKLLETVFSPLALAELAGYTAIGNTLFGIAESFAMQLKDGAININGAGTSTSDSIPAMLSKGESVINARSTAQNEPYLRYINNGGDMSKLVNMNMNTKNIENLLYTNNELLRSKNFNPSINNVNKFNVSSSSIKVVRGR
jgi:hypothetical protein